MTGRTEIDLGGSELGERLQDAGFTVSVGLDEVLAEQLVEISKKIGMYPDDRTVRFPDVDSTFDWFRRKRRFLVVAESAEQLAALASYSAKKYPGANKTSTIRIYRKMQDAGIETSRLFVKVAHEQLVRQLGYTGGIGMDIALTNHYLQRVIESAGYVHHNPTQGEQRPVYIKPGVDEQVETK